MTTTAHVTEDIRAKVTGRARYASDLEMPGTLHGALVRSDVAHGLLVRVDTSEAEQMPGVHCVLTAADFDGIDPYYGELVLDQPMLAIDRVRYIGEPVAAVVASTRAEAVEAARSVTFEIEPLPTAFTSEEALRSDAPVIQPNGPGATGEFNNICRESSIARGDVDVAFEQAAFVHHASYDCPPVYHYAMEPHCSLASWESGRLEVISGTQQPFRVRDTLARMFSLPASRVSVRAPYVGGAYGSKGETKYEPVVAAMARKAGRPVKLLISVDEAIHTVTRHGCRVEMWSALDSDGTITGRRSEVTFDTGAYSDKGPRIAHRGAIRVTGPYRIPNYSAVSRAVFTNTVPAGAFRGFSTSQVLWASESAMDEIARHLGEDPIAYRRRHVLRGEEPYIGFDSPMDADLDESLTRAENAIGTGDLPAGTGRALALGVKDGGGGAATAAAHLHLHLDGSVEVIAGASDIGQGVRGMLIGLTARTLGIPREQVEVRVGDTDNAPFDRGTNASRTTVGIGTAVAKAAAQTREIVAEAWRKDVGTDDELRIEGDRVIGGSESRSLGELLAAAVGLPQREFPGLSVTATHTDAAEPGSSHFPTMFYEACTTAARVKVDTDTGQIELQRLVSVAETGFALDPAACHGQNIGAAMMGVGTTLSEQLTYEQGELINSNMIEYRVPTIEFLPTEGFDSILVEGGEGPGPDGAKGIGEAGIIVVAPAIANAVEDAVGIRLRSLPLHPETVWRAMNEPPAQTSSWEVR
jgi:CO/xanthine dehydrogenase Mo-binding subunit